MRLALAAQHTVSATLQRLDPDRLLAPFRREAGLPSRADSYGGWESDGLDGHTAGHVLSAASTLAAAGDAAAADLARTLVRGIRECQLATGSGYVGGAPGGAAPARAAAPVGGLGPLTPSCHCPDARIGARQGGWSSRSPGFAGFGRAFPAKPGPPRVPGDAEDDDPCVRSGIRGFRASVSGETWTAQGRVRSAASERPGGLREAVFVKRRELVEPLLVRECLAALSVQRVERGTEPCQHVRRR
ncbi:beta-L-arabinofuranosidase domain-containing protein [Microbacterium sp. LWS13-1.2]|uniref:Glycoside hydrolase family 127 protein n=1 Tax=Microbacterium sp. LWS13-1.2 TaxID=3135264 RepID=A0AAU6SBR7_9MICO